MTSHSYTSVPGSARLLTHARAADGAVAELEALDPAQVAGREIGGQWLARAVVRDRYVPVLLDVFDRLALEQDALEQVVYLHLFRLALGEERNHCRVSRSELSRRTHLSDRRLGKALAALVQKGHVALADRDRRGTLYRVFFPYEVFGESAHDTVHVAKKRGGVAPLPQKGTPHNPPQSASLDAMTPLPQEGPPHSPPQRAVLDAEGETEPLQKTQSHLKSHGLSISPPSKRISNPIPQTMGTVAAAFIAQFGEYTGRSKADVLDAILDRLENGCSLSQVHQELCDFARKAPKSTPLSELERFLVRQIGRAGQTKANDKQG